MGVSIGLTKGFFIGRLNGNMGRTKMQEGASKLAQVARFLQIWVVNSVLMMLGFKVDWKDFSSRFL